LCLSSISPFLYASILPSLIPSVPSYSVFPSGHPPLLVRTSSLATSSHPYLYLPISFLTIDTLYIAIYRQTSILRASIIREPLLCADFFQKVVTPYYFVCLSPCRYCKYSGLWESHIIMTEWYYDDVMKSLAIESLPVSIISFNLGEYHYLTTELQCANVKQKHSDFCKDIQH
jgi:hypothetical protein